MKVSGGQALFRSRSLRELVALAYGVEPTQLIETGEPLASVHFDIQAKLPEGSAKGQVPAMLRAMLEERFNLKADRENRLQDIYFLEQAKGGHKMKAAPPEPPADANAEPEFEMPLSVRIRGMKTKALGATPNEGMRYESERLTMGELAQYISPKLDRRVVDRTGLTGTYQVTIDVSLEESFQALRSYGNASPGLRLPPAAPGSASDPSGALIPASLKRLGLSLEKGRGEVEMIVVDSVEFKPTEN